jgi:hypothetical protein
MVTGTFIRWIGTVLRAASIVAMVLIVAGLLGFLTDAVRDSSQASATRVTSYVDGKPQTKSVDIALPDPPPAVERLREQRHTAAREVIDDAGDALMSPFTWIAKGSDEWVRRLLYSGLALLIYGLLGQIVADRLVREGNRSRRAAFAAAAADAARKRRESGSYLSPA